MINEIQPDPPTVVIKMVANGGESISFDLLDAEVDMDSRVTRIGGVRNQASMAYTELDAVSISGAMANVDSGAARMLHKAILDGASIGMKVTPFGGETLIGDFLVTRIKHTKGLSRIWITSEAGIDVAEF